jgi:ATP-dependent Clp protease adaptor protein ClpS
MKLSGSSSGGNKNQPGAFQSFLQRLLGGTAISEPEQTEEPVAPPMFGVHLHNNPHTPHLTVTRVLTEVFGMTSARANELMMQVHLAGAEGKALVGVYVYGVAEDKVRQAKALEDTDLTALFNKDWPRALQLSVEPETN